MKFIRNFDTKANMDTWAGGITDEENYYLGGNRATEDVILVKFSSAIPNNEIWYNTSDNQVISNFANVEDGNTLVSNTCDSIGKCIAKYTNDVTSINGLSYCTTLTAIYLPDSVTTINALARCTGLGTVDFGQVTTINGDAFYECTSLDDIILPVTLTNIGSQAFHNCTSLGTVNYKGTVAQWNAITFGSSWHGGTTPLTTIICTDGNVTL